MAGLAMLCLLLGRPRAGLPMLLLAVTVLLLADPWLSTSPGFALSAAATGGLILLAPPLARGLGRWVPAPIATVIAVPLAAQLACAPIIALFADRQSLVGVVANLLAAPAAPVATVLGLLACLAMPLPPVADLLTAAAWLPSAWIAATAQTTADLPFATVSVPAGVPAALTLSVVGAAVMRVIVPYSPLSDSPGAVRRWRIVGARTAGVVSGAIVVTVLAFGIGQAAVEGPIARLSRPQDWAIAACDIGQGDAILVRSGGHDARRHRAGAGAPSCVPGPPRRRPTGPGGAHALRSRPRRRGQGPRRSRGHGVARPTGDGGRRTAPGHAARWGRPPPCRGGGSAGCVWSSAVACALAESGGEGVPAGQRPERRPRDRGRGSAVVDLPRRPVRVVAGCAGSADARGRHGGGQGLPPWKRRSGPGSLRAAGALARPDLGGKGQTDTGTRERRRWRCSDGWGRGRSAPTSRAWRSSASPTASCVCGPSVRHRAPPERRGSVGPDLPPCGEDARGAAKAGILRIPSPCRCRGGPSAPTVETWTLP